MGDRRKSQEDKNKGKKEDEKKKRQSQKDDLKKSQHKKDDLKKSQHKKDDLKKSQHSQHSKEDVKKRQSQKDDLKKSQHQKDDLKKSQHQKDDLKKSQHQKVDDKKRQSQKVDVPKRESQHERIHNERKSFGAKDFLAAARNQAMQKLRMEFESSGYILTKNELDLNFLLQSTREMINNINDIWNRAKLNMAGKDAVELVKRKVNDRTQKVAALTVTETTCTRIRFQRYGYFTVHVTTATADIGASEHRNLVFTTSCELVVDSFDLLPQMPGALLEIISAPAFAAASPQEILPDFMQYVVKAMVLSNDILLPFLAILKQHLKVIHKNLQDIDTWLLGPGTTARFLNKQFGTKLRVPVITDPDGDDIKMIKSIPLSEGEIRKTFLIGTEAQQEKLVKFVSFATAV